MAGELIVREIDVLDVVDEAELWRDAARDAVVREVEPRQVAQLAHLVRVGVRVSSLSPIAH